MSYIGRFAPSPSGPLHFGSLVAALASFLDARSQQGSWLLRMEDLDPPREEPGAAQAILQSLEAHHLLWDGEVLYQSQRAEAYRDALQHLQQHDLCFPCTCSRQDLQQGDRYPGHCRHRHFSTTTEAHAWRLNVANALEHLQQGPELGYHDLLQGQYHRHLIKEDGDFVIHRKDGLFAYQLAVVVDDIHQHISHVIRGSDLLDSTPRQILLFQLLGHPPPRYGHIPLVLNTQGQKLSKQHHAPALEDHRASSNLHAALQFLRQSPPPELATAGCEEILDWAIQHWQLASLKGLQ